MVSNPLRTLNHMKPHRLHCTTDLFSGNCDGFDLKVNYMFEGFFVLFSENVLKAKVCCNC